MDKLPKTSGAEPGIGTRFVHGEASKNGKRDYYREDESPVRLHLDWRRLAGEFVQAVPSRFTDPKGYRVASSLVMDDMKPIC